MNKSIRCLMLLASFALCCPAAVLAQSAGGAYAVTRSVVASGGGTGTDAVNNNYKIEGTGGQALADGNVPATGGYALRGGFWSEQAFAPTAAHAALGGRVMRAAGGLGGATVILSGGRLFAPRQARTNTFGYFSFDEVEVGQTYIVTVLHRKYRFANASQVVSVLDNVNDLLFQTDWEN